MQRDAHAQTPAATLPRKSFKRAKRVVSAGGESDKENEGIPHRVKRRRQGKFGGRSRAVLQDITNVSPSSVIVYHMLSDLL
jgi:hypothetical protein